MKIALHLPAEAPAVLHIMPGDTNQVNFTEGWIRKNSIALTTHLLKSIILIY